MDNSEDTRIRLTAVERLIVAGTSADPTPTTINSIKEHIKTRIAQEMGKLATDVVKWESAQDGRIGNMYDKFNNRIDTRIEELEIKLDDKFNRIDARIEQLETGLLSREASLPLRAQCNGMKLVRFSK